MLNDQPALGPREKAMQVLGLLAVACQILAVSVEVILHRRMGRRALGFPALVATFAILFWGLLFPGEDLTPLLRFWEVFLAGCVVNRLFRAPPQEHGLYTGQPWLSLVFRRTDEARLKGVLEPALVFFAGVFLYPVSHSLGTYLMTACFGLAGSITLSEMALKAKVEHLHDARLEQEQVAREFERLHGS